jgi:AraC family transcriptional regulator
VLVPGAAAPCLAKPAGAPQPLPRWYPGICIMGTMSGDVSVRARAPGPVAGYVPVGGGTFVLHERASTFFARGTGALSIKSFYGGRALYRAGGALRAVDDRSYLLLNAGQSYSIEIDAATPVESLCVFFGAALAADARRSLTAAAETLLDDPFLQAGAAPAVYEQTYPHDECVSPALQALRTGLPERLAEPGWLVEQVHDLMQRVVSGQQAEASQAESLPGARRGTRLELYRRLHMARDYMAACYDSPLSLDDIARAASLSPSYLLRTFKAVFHQTPHQYLTTLRLEQACRLLTQTTLPVTAICTEIGFGSLGSFSWLFRQRTGLAPSQYRLKTG